jgi:hypothetical protein
METHLPEKIAVPPVINNAHDTKTSTPMTTSKHTKTRYILIAAFGVLCIGLTLLATYASKQLPGESLYAFKTSVVEETIAFTKLSAAQKIAYNTKRLETRMAELTALSRDQSSTTPDVLATVATLSDAHASAALSALAAAQKNPTAEHIDTLAALSTITKSEVTLADATSEFETITDSLENTDRNVNSFLKSSIGAFASSSPTDVVYAYIDAHIRAVSTESSQVAPGSTAAATIIRRISDTNEAITDGDMAEAINSIIKARQAIAIDGLLWDAERGPIEGMPIPSTEIPEGN